MSEEQLKAFLEKLKADTNLQEKLEAASDADAVVAIAKEAGFQVDIEVLKNTSRDITEEEMEMISGGFLGGIRATEWLINPAYRQQVIDNARRINMGGTYKTDGCWDGAGG